MVSTDRESGSRRHAGTEKGGDEGEDALHILTYARDLRGGGVERAQLRLIRGWLAAGARVTLVLGTQAGPLARELPPGVVIRTGMTRATLPRFVRAARPDILFCAGNSYTAHAAWTRLVLGPACPPIVGKMSNAPVRADHGGVMRWLQARWLARHGGFLDHLVAMTPATAADAEVATRMAGRTSVIPNPPVEPVPGAATPALPTRYILGVGRLEPQKRWDRLIAAVPRIGDPDIALVILGEGGMRARLEAQVAALGLDGRVHLPGHAGDPLGAMAGAALVALTSDYEGVPGVLREALSVGTPVVTTDSSRSVAEIVSDPTHGVIVPIDDEAALVDAIDAVLAAPRPAPVPQPGGDAAQAYLTLFTRLVRR